ncbi:MAG: DUF2059 domain-containing protein [Holophagaceae bacterium]|nr:DUF2059 domain-containing protein [Holophagaceae bacterium]
MSVKSLCATALAAAALFSAAGLSADTKQATAKSAAAPKPAPTEKVVDKAKGEAIAKLLNTTGVVAKNVDAIKQSLAETKKANPKVDPRVFDELEKGATPNVVGNLLVHVYDHYYSLGDVKALNKFFSSKEGQAYLAKQTTVDLESGRILQLYMENLGKKLAPGQATPTKKK